MILQKLRCRQAFLWSASEHFQHDGEDQFSLTWICVWAPVRYCFCEFTMVRLAPPVSRDQAMVFSPLVVDQVPRI